MFGEYENHIKKSFLCTLSNGYLKCHEYVKDPFNYIYLLYFQLKFTIFSPDHYSSPL